MILVLNHGKSLEEKGVDYYHITCECGCEFVCTKYDFNQYDNGFLEKMGKKSLHCPDCHKKIYNTHNMSVFAYSKGTTDPNKYISPITIQSISKETYEELINPEFN